MSLLTACAAIPARERVITCEEIFELLTLIRSTVAAVAGRLPVRIHEQITLSRSDLLVVREREGWRP
jgi:hypothetical protein